MQPTTIPAFTKILFVLNLKQQPEAERALRAGWHGLPDLHQPLSPRAHAPRCGERGGGDGETQRAIAVIASFEPAYLALASI